MLEVQGLSFSYNHKPVFSDVSFRVEQGELCGLFGPNGSGKTTLFKCCMNFLKPEHGSVQVAGREIKRMKIEEMARLVSYVPQEHKPPFPYLVREVVLMGRTPYLGGVFGVTREDKMKAIRAMELLEITDLADRPYSQLSGGQRQLVLIARAVAQETPLMLLDEPTSALDFSNQIRIWRILKRIAADGTTIVACSHDPNHISWFCSDVVVMDRGGLVAKGHPQQVISDRLLGRIYSDICCVGSLNSLKMVYPRDLSTAGDTTARTVAE